MQTFAQHKQKYNKISKQPNDGAEYEQLTAKSSVFPPIWLSYHLFFSQIERFSFDLAKERLVVNFLFHPFNYPLELIIN